MGWERLGCRGSNSDTMRISAEEGMPVDSDRTSAGCVSFVFLAHRELQVHLIPKDT